MNRDHARRMDAVYAGQRHIYDLTRKYYLLGRDRMLADLAPPSGGSVLEIGCGTARNLIAAARRWPDARFHGVDISEAMLMTARTNVMRAGLAHRIVLARGDATDFDPVALFEVERFDRIFISYSLSMIPGWRDAMGHAASLLADGGALRIVDFGQQERLPDWWRRALFAWLARFEVAPRGDLGEAVQGVAVRTGLNPAFRPLLRGYAWSASLTA